MLSTEKHSVFTDYPSTPIHPAARSFLLPGGPTGILFIHGYGGSIGDYRPLAESFHQAGYTVAGVCLAGHGQTSEILGATSMEDWRASVRQAVQDLQSRCDSIILIGSSFGGALALDFAIHAPTGIQAVVTINTGLSYRGAGSLQKFFLQCLRPFKRNWPKHFATPQARGQALAMGSLLEWPIRGILETYRCIETYVSPDLANLQTPLLVLIDPSDPVINPSSTRQMYQQAGSSRKVYRELSGAEHNPLRNAAGRQQVMQYIQEFLAQS